jgi:hypothetical protein
MRVTTPGQRMREAWITVLVWPAGFAALAAALAFSGGRSIWVPFTLASAEVGLLVGVLHLVAASAIRRFRNRRSASRPAG